VDRRKVDGLRSPRTVVVTLTTLEALLEEKGFLGGGEAIAEAKVVKMDQKPVLELVITG